MTPHLRKVIIMETVGNAGKVAVASLKDVELERVFRHVREDAFLSINPGSREFDEPHVSALKKCLLQRPPDLLALNEGEMASFMSENIYDSTGGVDIDQVKRLALQANKSYAKYLLCTLGQSGMLLAFNGTVEHHPEPDIPQDSVIDNLGAGDRAHAIAADLLSRGEASAEKVLEQAAAGVATVITTVGAHGDLYHRFSPNGHHPDNQ